MMFSLLFLPTIITSITAQVRPTVNIYLLTDKVYYKYGETGKLYVTVRNEGPGPIAIRNIEVTFPWFGWYHGSWTGNVTITEIEDNLVDENAASKEFEVQFTVPTEGQAGITGNAEVSVEYKWLDKTTSVTEHIPILTEWPVTQGELLTPIYYSTVAILVLLILAIVVLVFLWLTLRKLTLPPVAPTE